MLRVFMSSHAHFASGIQSSLEIFMSNVPNLTVYDAYVDGDDSTVAEQLDSFYEDVSDEDDVLLLSDIYGGSVNTVMCGYLDRPRTRLVTGINLPFLIEVMSESELDDQRLDEIIDASRQFLKRVQLGSYETSQNAVDPDDFFD